MMKNKSMVQVVGIALGLLILAAPAGANSPPLIYNLQAYQKPSTNLVEVHYGLSDPDGDTASVSLYLSIDGGLTWPLLCVTVSGDVGPGISSGSGKIASWDAGADYPGYNGTDCFIRVVADDGFVEDGFRLIPGATFLMGSPDTEPIRGTDELQHYVLLDSFRMSETEVTQAQWAAAYPGYVVTNPNLPISGVPWYEAVQYCNDRSVVDGFTPAYSISGTTIYLLPGTNGYRLPTEAQWEYACRAGTSTPFNTGACLDATTEANYNGNFPYSGCPSGTYLGYATDVASYPANDFGLFDLHGNIWEWCWDVYIPYPTGTTQGNPDNNPTWAGGSSTSFRVVRGGGWAHAANACRSAERSGGSPASLNPDIGFRLTRPAN